MDFLHSATFAVAVQLEVNIWSVAFVLAMLALTVWFVVISIDVATDFRRFQKQDARSARGAEPKRRTEQRASQRQMS